MPTDAELSREPSIDMEELSRGVSFASSLSIDSAQSKDRDSRLSRSANPNWRTGILYASGEYQGCRSIATTDPQLTPQLTNRITSFRSMASNLNDNGNILFGAKGEYQGSAPPPHLTRFATPASNESSPTIFPSTFISNPPPPEGLWDTDDVQFLEKVTCSASIAMTLLDPKNGYFTGRMKFDWDFRVLNFPDETEPRIRVPGIRMPGVKCEVVESRIWRHFKGDSEKTRHWKGFTLLTFAGYEVFEVYDFPYDRQVIDLDLFEFVWRTEKATDCFFEAMKIVKFSLTSKSLLPDWACFPAIIDPRNIIQLGTGPTCATRFIVKLRLQRKETYYVFHVFFIAFLITCVCLFPLALAPGKQYIGDRITLGVSGLLTLVGFKNGVADTMPCVPYRTFASTYLQNQIVTVVAIAGEGLTSYTLVVHGIVALDTVDFVENILLGFLLLLWFGYFSYCAFFFSRTPWADVINSQTTQVEITEDTQRRMTHHSGRSTKSSKEAKDLERTSRLKKDTRSFTRNVAAEDNAVEVHRRKPSSVNTSDGSQVKKKGFKIGWRNKTAENKKCERINEEALRDAVKCATTCEKADFNDLISL